MKILGAFILASVLLSQAPAPPPSPVVSESNRLQLQVLTLRIENAQLRARAAQMDFEKAQAEGVALVQTLQVPGYTLDPQTLIYTKTTEPKK